MINIDVIKNSMLISVLSSVCICCSQYVRTNPAVLYSCVDLHIEERKHSSRIASGYSVEKAEIEAFEYCVKGTE